MPRSCRWRAFAAAEPLWEEYRQLSQQNSYSEGVANALCGLGLAAYGQGNYATARDRYLPGLAGQTIDTVGANTNLALAQAAARAVVLVSAGAELLRGELDAIVVAI